MEVTAIEKTAHKNVTLSLPEDLLRQFRVYAATRNQSMTQLMTQAIQRMLADDEVWEESKRRFLDGIRNAEGPWTRNGVINVDSRRDS